MKRAAQPALSVESLLVFDQYMHLLQRMEDLSIITIRNYYSDLQQFIAWCECCWREEQHEQPFTLQEVPPPLLIRYRTYLQTILWFKPATMSRTLLSFKRRFSWAMNAKLVQRDPTNIVNLVSEGTASLRHIGAEKQITLVAVVDAAGTRRDRAIITLFLRTGLRARELCRGGEKRIRTVHALG